MSYFIIGFFCHGDLMYGEGMFADGFNPRPINFLDETINQLQEAFLFWRITTGGPGPDNKLAPMMDYKAVSAQGKWHEGRWQVMMKRKRTGTDGEISFTEGEFIPVSFANWDGSNNRAVK